MKIILLLTAVSVLSIHVVYATPIKNSEEEGFINVRLSTTRLFQSETDPELTQGIEYRIKQNAPKPTGKFKKREVLEKTDYLDVAALFGSLPSVEKGEDEFEKPSDEDVNILRSLYLQGKLQLSWSQGNLDFTQYCLEHGEFKDEVQRLLC